MTVLVSRVFAVRRSRLRALPSLNLKKTRDYSQSNKTYQAMLDFS